jgi:hypothetical protein
MGDTQVIERIAAWEAAGLIGSDVAARLRAAEADVPADAGRHSPISNAAAFFGPAVTIAEMFGYLGTGFVLAAWYALIGRIAGDSGDHDTIWALGYGLAAVVFVLLGVGLLRGPARAQRAAGAALLVAAGTTGGALYSAGQVLTNIEPQLLTVAATAGALIAMALFRRIHPALLTQLGVIAGITQLAYAFQGWAEQVLFPPGAEFGTTAAGSPDLIVKVLLTAGLWLLVALLVGLLGRWEAAAGTAQADRRAALSRVWAGFVAVLGVTAAVIFAYQYDPVTYESRRVVEPFVGDLAILLVAGILLERAFRREASAFVYPAGLGVIIALTDLNASYLAKATSTEIGLLVEGVILLVAGFAIERLRRRVGGRPNGSPLPISPGAAPAA